MTDLTHAYALPGHLYHGAEAHGFDAERILRRSWQLLGLVSQVRDSGDHLVADIGGVPVLVVRDEHGVLRGFENICRHRAGPLATCAGRGAKALRCRYHGWTYTLAGQLRAATEMAGTPDFKMEDIHLNPIQVAVVRGLVFAAIEPDMSIDELLTGTEKKLGSRDFSHYEFERRQSFPVACNWKLYVENYLEGYHVPHVHPALNALLDYRSYVTEAEHWHSLQWSPMESAASGNFYGEGDALYYCIWPNTMLNILPNRLQTNRVIATGPDTCVVDFDYYYPVDDRPEERQRRDTDQQFSEVVQAEDAEICAQVQRALASGRYQPGRINPKRENAVFHYHELIRRIYGPERL
ncbi:(2Fe-2S)-binding protein [Ahniella affigens]|uniref:(2Fe-2S)-binding protein n=1 Tax=Ahniella affigens TaxID=2021234 RepID=A0A2P1PT90_9GAMM|nr:SRPBCC family protein [Ahniella affigens]AVP98067.1 (2Fe-2S)-binding protein [Ahniella affigens]